MKTIEQMQFAVDEIRKVCMRHGVVLIGTCRNEGIYGEITICENVMDACGWVEPNNAVDNKVLQDMHDGYSLGGIGDFVG